MTFRPHCRRVRLPMTRLLESQSLATQPESGRAGTESERSVLPAAHRRTDVGTSRAAVRASVFPRKSWRTEKDCRRSPAGGPPGRRADLLGGGWTSWAAGGPRADARPRSRGGRGTPGPVPRQPGPSPRVPAHRDVLPSRCAWARVTFRPVQRRTNPCRAD